MSKMQLNKVIFSILFLVIAISIKITQSVPTGVKTVVDLQSLPSSPKRAKNGGISKPSTTTVLSRKKVEQDPKTYPHKTRQQIVAHEVENPLRNRLSRENYPDEHLGVPEYGSHRWNLEFE